MPPEEEEEEGASSSSLVFQKVTVAGARPKKNRLQFSPLPPPNLTLLQEFVDGRGGGRGRLEDRRRKNFSIHSFRGVEGRENKRRF